jgi:peptidoglycan/xylan/chitin deacetylase (PgdA/CDA1 family)
LTTEQIVAELGWTRLAIQKVLGVTPTLMRPPYGDIGALHKTEPADVLKD